MTWETSVDVFDEGDEAEDTLDQAFFDYYRFSTPGPLWDVASKVTAILECLEKRVAPRQRSRKAYDQRSFLCSVDSIVSNLAHVFLQWGPQASVVVSRRKDPSAGNTNKSLPHTTFIHCLDILQQAELVSEIRGVHCGGATTIKSSPSLQRMFLDHGVDFGCFRQCPTRPLVTLRRSFKQEKGRKPKPKVSVPFKPTTDTDRMAAQVERINAFLSAADIEFVPDGHYPRVDTNERTLIRCFNLRGDQGIRFDQGGRLFGRTFWLGLKTERRGNLRIDGEPVADLDFKNLGPRLAYAMLGREAPDGDLYDLTGLLPGYDHQNDDHRKAIKRALASCLNGGKGGSRGINPRTGKPGILAPLPEGTSAEKVRRALLTKHPGFAGFFKEADVPVGFAIMFAESRILLSALERLKDAGVVALPFHDGVMVAASKQQFAMEALQAASLEIVGVTLPVEVKADYGRPGEPEELLAA